MRFILFFIQSFFIFNLLHAQTSSSDKDKFEYLWKINKKGSSTEIYFAGTVHFPTSEKNHPVLMKLIQTVKFDYHSGEFQNSSIDQKDESRNASTLYRILYSNFNEKTRQCAGFYTLITSTGGEDSRPQISLPTKKIEDFKLDEAIIDCVNKTYSSSRLVIIPKEPNLKQIIGETLFQEVVSVFKKQKNNDDGNEMSDEELVKYVNTLSAAIALRTLEEEKSRLMTKAKLEDDVLDQFISNKMQNASVEDLGGLDQYVVQEDIVELIYYMEASEQSRAEYVKNELSKLPPPISPENIYDLLGKNLNSKNSDPNEKEKDNELQKKLEEHPFDFQPSVIASMVAEGEASKSRDYELLITNRNKSWVSFVEDIFTTKYNKKVLLYGGVMHLYGRQGVFSQLLGDDNQASDYTISIVYLNKKKNKISEQIVKAKDFIEVK